VWAWTIKEWPLQEQPDELIAELYQADAALHEEATPDDPRPPLAAEIAGARNMPAPVGGQVLVARDALGAIAGYSRCTWEDLPGWDHALDVRIAVLPAERCQGLGRVLLDRSAGVAAARGLRLMVGRTQDTVPAGAAFCRRFGAVLAQVMRENRLDLRGVDWALVDRWLADGPARAPGYRLVFVEGQTPPELAQQAVAALNIMNTAPRDDLDVGDVQLTAELLREYERAGQARGDTRLAYYAAQDATGRFVGLTDIGVRAGCPDRVYVGDTAVDPGHRGQGLGKWLKGAMTARIAEQLPEVRWVITWNSRTNDAMLAINHQLGFRATAAATTWQVTTDPLRARLADARQPGARQPGDRQPGDQQARAD
jgi:GNAT superfamily N-acetyltransferase